jgi:hypothetical protein
MNLFDFWIVAAQVMHHYLHLLVLSQWNGLVKLNPADTV